MKRKPNDLERIQHMIDAIDKIDQFTAEMDYKAFFNNEMAQFAVIKNLEIIGEAAYQISRAFKDAHDKVDWTKIEGMCHVLVHDYYRINVELIWNTKEEKLVDLKIQLEEMLEEGSS